MGGPAGPRVGVTMTGAAWPAAIEARLRPIHEKMTQRRKDLLHEAAFLAKVTGRGAFFLFIGTLQMSCWPSLLDFACGVWMALVGVLCLSTHLKTKKSMAAMIESSGLEAEQAFAQADKDGDGQLDFNEIKALGDQRKKHKAIG